MDLVIKPAEASSLPPLPADADAEFVQAAAEGGEDFYSICSGGQTVGAALAPAEDGSAFLYICIFPEHRRRGYGGQAAALLEEKLFAAGSCSIQTCWRTGDGGGAALAARRGYAVQYASSYMVRRGAPLETKPLDLRPYRDGDYDRAHALYAEAFHRMRLGTGHFPDSVPEPPGETSRKEWAATAADRVVLELEGGIAGIAHLEGGMIDGVAVTPSLQGRGIGKQFVSHLVNRLLERGHREISLYCLTDNHTAQRLYKGLGFQTVYCNNYGIKSE